MYIAEIEKERDLKTLFYLCTKQCESYFGRWGGERGRGWETKCLIKRLQFVCSGKSWKRERLKFWTEITRNSNPPSHPGAYSIKPFHKLRPNESWILPKLCGNLWAMFGHNFWICNLQRNKFVGTGTWANIIKLYLSVSLTLNYVLFINNKAKLRQIPNDS